MVHVLCQVLVDVVYMQCTSSLQQFCEVGDAFPVLQPNLVESEERAFSTKTMMPLACSSVPILLCPWVALWVTSVRFLFHRDSFIMPKGYHWLFTVSGQHRQTVRDIDQLCLRRFYCLWLLWLLKNTNIYFLILMMITIEFSTCYFYPLKHHIKALSV